MIEYEDRRTPEERAKQEKQFAQWRADRERCEAQLAEARANTWTDPPWRPIEDCPFELLRDSYGLQGSIFVTDGQSVALATVTERFGTPVHVTTQRFVLTDRGYELECETEEIDAPDWWFKWELTDEFGDMTYAGGEETGKEEVGFIPTHWFFACPPVPA